MALSPDDFRWLQERFDAVSDGCRTAVRQHEDRYHAYGSTLKTAGALLGIGAAGVAILGALLSGLLWLVRHAP